MSRLLYAVDSAGSIAKPFLKWPGGKRWLTDSILELTPQSFGTYFEPFLGGGALFFALNPEKAVLSDINGDLINTYIQVKRRPHELVRRLMEIQVDKGTYDNFRQSSPTRQLERATRFLYLNRTAFGGIYRLNRMGMFNVPYGGGERTPDPLWSENLLVNASRRLKRAHLHATDFEEVLTGAKAGDLVYCDPTYTVAHNNNGFVRYNERNFSWNDQKRLADTCRRLCKEGVTVFVSNADHTDIVELFRPPRLLRLDRMSLLSPDSEKRRATTELLFVFHRSRVTRLKGTRVITR